MPVQKHTLGLPVPVLSFDGFSTELKLGRFSYLQARWDGQGGAVAASAKRRFCGARCARPPG